MRLYRVGSDELSRIRSVAETSGRRSDLFADVCRVNALYMIQRAGSGHIGSSFSSLDIVAWLALNRPGLFEDGGGFDVYFSSKGHDVPGLYSVLIALGVLPFESVDGLRRLGGLPGHPDVRTPGSVVNSGSLGMGISKAKGIIHAARLQDHESRVVVMTGDGELQEGQIWESLQSASSRGMGELTVVVDHNKLQSDTWISKVSDLGDLEAKFRSFGWEVLRCDGHDREALGEAFERASRSATIPTVIIADTVKGRGVSFMESTSFDVRSLEQYPYHSGALNEAHYDKAFTEIHDRIQRGLADLGTGALVVDVVEVADRVPPPDDAQRLVAAYGGRLVELAERHPELVVFDADLAFDCGLLEFKARYPERFFECGIAEQDMVSQAGGMALRGCLPVVHSFACFLSSRPNEQIYTNATERSKLIYLGALAGVTPGGPGHSHQAVRDISSLGGIPGMVIIEPCSESEARAALDWAVEHNPLSTYIRMVSLPTALPFDYGFTEMPGKGRGRVIREGGDAILFAYGPVLLAEAWKAADRLAERGIELGVVNLPWLNELDGQWLAEQVRDMEFVFTLDNHYEEGGQGQRIAARISSFRAGGAPSVLSIGVTDIPVCGANDEVLRHHGLDADSLANRIASGMGF